MTASDLTFSETPWSGMVLMAWGPWQWPRGKMLRLCAKGSGLGNGVGGQGVKMDLLKKLAGWDFPGGAVVKNPPANAGDTGSSPGPGRSHMPQSS